MKRRSFIQKTAIGSAAMITAFPYPAMAKDKKLKLGLIGCGWYGMVDATTALKVGGVEFIAMCDIDTEHLKSSTDKIEELQGKRPKEYKDYRELLDNKKLDAVIIATPPHWHALQFIAACEQGLDVYCEKPLAYDIDESKAMVNAARKAGNIVQIRNCSHGSRRWWRGCSFRAPSSWAWWHCRTSTTADSSNLVIERWRC